MVQNQEYSTFGRQVGYVVFANIAILLFGLIQLPILTKGLGASLYGMWSLIVVTVSLIVPFALLRFETSVVRFLAAEKDRSRVREDFISAVFVVFLGGIVFALILILLSGILAEYIFKDTDAAGYIRFASILIILNSMYMLMLAFFRMRRRIGLYTTIHLVHAAFQLGLIAAFILLDYELTGVITAVAISAFLCAMVAMVIIFREIGLQVPRFTNVKSYLKWGIPLTPNAAILWIIHTSDRYMVSYFLGLTSAGIYSAAYGIGNYAAFVLAPLGTVLYPTIAKHYDEGNLEETRNYLRYSVRYLMMISIPAAFGLSILAKPLLEILTTSEFVSGKNVVPYVASGIVLFGVYQLCIYILHLVNRTRWAISLISAAAVLNIVLNVILIPRMDIEGAALATLISYGLLGVLTIVVTRRYIRFGLSMPFILKSAAASGVMTLCIWLLDPGSIGLVIASIVIGALIYFIILILLKGLSRSELTFFFNFAWDNLRKVLLVK